MKFKWCVHYWVSTRTMRAKYVVAETAKEAIRKARCHYIVELYPVDNDNKEIPYQEFRRMAEPILAN